MPSILHLLIDELNAGRIDVVGLHGDDLAADDPAFLLALSGDVRAHEVPL